MSSDMRSIHFVPYLAVSKAGNLEKLGIDNTLTINVAKSAQTEWALLAVFTSNPNRVLHFFFNYEKLNAVTIHNYYPCQGWKNT